MDPQRFDSLARSLQDVRSRRGTLSSLLVGALGLFGVSGNDAAAKNCKKIKNKTKRKKCLAKAKGALPPPPSCPDGQRLCRGGCLSVLICCDSSDCAGGRTCQAGTCACPAEKPKLCAGSTICQQCCVKADCTSLPISGPGISECVTGVCTCAQPGTRYCRTGGADNGRCGTCCSNAECTNQQICHSFTGDSVMACSCSRSESDCTAAGQTRCIREECQSACGQSCDPQNDTPCPCPADLQCLFDSAVQDYRCAPW